MKKIGWWTIKVHWEDEHGNPMRDKDGEPIYEYVDDIPNWVSSHVDDFLTELEGERNG